MSTIPENLLDQKDIIRQAFADPTSVSDAILLNLFKSLVEKNREYNRRILKMEGEIAGYGKELASFDFVVKDELGKAARERYIAEAKAALAEGEELAPDFAVPTDLPLDEPPAMVKRLRAAIVQRQEDSGATLMQIQGERYFCMSMVNFMKQLAGSMEAKAEQMAGGAEAVVNPDELEEIIKEGGATPPAPVKDALSILLEEYAAAGKCTHVERGSKVPCGNKQANKKTPYCRKHQ